MLKLRVESIGQGDIEKKTVSNPTSSDSSVVNKVLVDPIWLYSENVQMKLKSKALKLNWKGNFKSI